jgi:glycosyltransferase 2 family protein
MASVKPKLKRIILSILRWGLCVGALVYVLSGVSWHDFARVSDGSAAAVYPILRADWNGRGEIVSFTYRGADGVEISRSRQELEQHNGTILYGFRSTVQHSDKGLLILSLIIFAPVTFLASLRLVWMLRAQEISVSWWEATKLTFAGNFFNFAVPGTTGGDVYKAYYIAQHTDRKTEAVTTVFLDRAIGLIGLCLLGGIAILFRLNDPGLRHLGGQLLLVMAVLAVGSLVFYSHRLRALLHVGAILDRLPLREQLRRIDKTTFRMRHHKLIVLSTLLLTGVLQSLAIASFTAAGRAMGMTHSLPAFFAGLAAGLLVAAIPLTPMSAGTMEAIFAVLFVGPDASGSQVLFLALAVRLIQLVWALPGVLVPLTRSNGVPGRPSDIDAPAVCDTPPA